MENMMTNGFGRYAAVSSLVFAKAPTSPLRALGDVRPIADGGAPLALAPSGLLRTD